MRKILIFGSLILIIMTSCRELINPVDPEAENYQGYYIYDEDSIPDNAVISITGISPEISASLFDTTPLLDWDDVDKAEGFQLQIADNVGSLSDSELISLNDSQYQIPLEKKLEYDKDYYWRVRIANGNNLFSAWSEVYHFSVDWNISWTGLVPSDKGTSIDTTPLLEWDDVGGASGYKVRYANSSGGLSTATINDVTTSEYPISKVQTLGSTAYWQVLAIDEDGVPTNWSTEFSFTVDWNITWSGISPADGGSTLDTTPLLNWDDVAAAASYQLRYASTEAGLTAAAVNPAPTSQYQYPTTLAIDDTVYWQVRAVNEDSVSSAWSGTMSFWISPDIGDIYAGGIVFYLDGTGGGLVAVGSDQSSDIEWGGYETSIGGTSRALGTGAANTSAIVNVLGSGTYAAKLCTDLTMVGYDDWFLPSYSELNLMYQNLHQLGIGGFSDSIYWSSSEYNSIGAWVRNFGNGDYGYGNKFATFNVRAVRAF